MNNITESLNIVLLRILAQHAHDKEKKNSLVTDVESKNTKPRFFSELASEKKLFSSFPANMQVTVSESDRDVARVSRKHVRCNENILQVDFPAFPHAALPQEEWV